MYDQAVRQHARHDALRCAAAMALMKAAIEVLLAIESIPSHRAP